MNSRLVYDHRALIYDQPYLSYRKQIRPFLTTPRQRDREGLRRLFRKKEENGLTRKG